MEEAAELIGRGLIAAGAAGIGVAGRQAYRDIREGLFDMTSVTPGKKRVRTGEHAVAPTLAPTVTIPRSLRTGLGEDPRFRRVQVFGVESGTNTPADKVCQQSRMIEIPYDANGLTTMNRRASQIVEVRGIKWSSWFVTRGDISFPISVRWVVYIPRVNDGTSGSTAPEKFFKSFSPDNDWATNFSTNSDTWDLMERAVNKREYRVLKGGRFVMRPKVTPGDNRGKPEYKHVKFWIPVRRKMRFPDNITQFPENNIYFAWWYCQYGDTGNAQLYNGTGATAPAVSEKHLKQTYFKPNRALV